MLRIPSEKHTFNSERRIINVKIELFSMDEFIDINKLKEVTSPVLFQRGDVPHPGGLVSNEIFGITINSRKNTFAYIDLGGHFFHPLVYKAIRRIFRNVDRIVSGTSYYSINKDGKLVPDENGETGIEFLYENWNKIKWEYSADTNGMRNERIDMITKNKKDIVFMKYLLVIPPFYRDIKTGSGTAETGDLNKYYASAIRLSNMIKDRNMFGFQFHATNYEIQNILVNIYDYFKGKLEKKNGMIRKYLMGKNVDYCTRSVITAPTFHANRQSDAMIDFKHSGIPIAQICALAYPFVLQWVKQFFERNVFDNKYALRYYNLETREVEEVKQLKNPESIYNEKYFERMINTYRRDPGSRFNKFPLQVEGSNKPKYLLFMGKVFDPSTKRETGSIINRPMTWTDLLYMACDEVTKDKHCMITRYPLTSEYNIFITKIRVLSTTETMPVMINNKLYKWYPIVDFSVNEHKIASKFIDSVQFSTSYLKGIGGDYDGDQTTLKILFTKEANNEITKYIDSKVFYIDSNYRTNRICEKECVQSAYVLTKEETTNKTKTVPDTEVQKIVTANPDDITFEYLVELFGNRASKDSNGHLVKTVAKYKTTDTVKLKPKSLFNDETIHTTIGRLIFNKVILEGSGVIRATRYQNSLIDGKGLEELESVISKALANDIITTNEMSAYIDKRDWLLMQLNAVICVSFTPNIIEAPKEVLKLRSELIKENKEGLKEGDPAVAEKIENVLLTKTKEVLNDDPGMDLYNSGARGSFGNNYKNMYLFRGAIKNEATGKFDIITNSLTDGLGKDSFAPHSNTILGGAYPKSVGTEVSGYMAKQLISFLQTELIGDKNTDCGTKKTLPIYLTNKIKKKYIDRYILDGNKIICLDTQTIDKYVGKTVHLFSPIFCLRDKNGNICNKCAGNAFYKIDKKMIGITCTQAATRCTDLNMKKFHNNTVKTQKIDLSDFLL